MPLFPFSAFPWMYGMCHSFPIFSGRGSASVSLPTVLLRPVVPNVPKHKSEAFFRTATTKPTQPFFLSFGNPPYFIPSPMVLTVFPFLCLDVEYYFFFPTTSPVPMTRVFQFFHPCPPPCQYVPFTHTLTFLLFHFFQFPPVFFLFFCF